MLKVKGELEGEEQSEQAKGSGFRCKYVNPELLTIEIPRKSNSFTLTLSAEAVLEANLQDEARIRSPCQPRFPQDH